MEKHKKSKISKSKYIMMKKNKNAGNCALASEKALAKDWNSEEDEEAWKNL